MRTTITIEDDVATLISQVQEARKARLKDVINEALRLGLQQMTSPPRRRTPYRTPAVSLGRCLVGNLDDVAEVLALAEGDEFR